MTIGPTHLYAAAIRPEKIRLQMEVMVELNGSRVAAARSQRGEFGMTLFKAANVSDKTRGTPTRREARMTLRTVRVACGGKPNRSPMVGVAGSARGRESLRYMMDRTVMACEALQVAGLFVEKPMVDTWQAEHRSVRTACAEDKPPAEYTRRSLRTAYHAIHRMASASAPTESKNRQWRSGFGLLK